jgi:hypothetical protein
MRVERSGTETNGTRHPGGLAHLAVATALAIVGFGGLVAALLGRLVPTVATPRTTSPWGRWHGRGRRAVSAPHAIILGLGVMIVVIAVIIILAASNYFPYLTPEWLLISGIALVFLGLIETLVGEEEGRGRRSRD